MRCPSSSCATSVSSGRPPSSTGCPDRHRAAARRHRRQRLGEVHPGSGHRGLVTPRLTGAGPRARPGPGRACCPRADRVLLRRPRCPDRHADRPEDVAFSLRRSGSPASSGRLASTRRCTVRSGRPADAPAHLLSSGEKQLLALASTLVREPALVICDEPTTLLDLRNAGEMAATIDSLTEHLVIVSHDLDLVAGCDRVIRLDDGVLTDDGPPGPVIDRYRRAMARVR